MPAIPYYHFDSFTDEMFKGNPAGVCLLESWLPDELLQKIAAENRHSETAFVIKEKDGFALRWCTPEREVDLCGHATLAAAAALQHAGWVRPQARIDFTTRFAGPLYVTPQDDMLWLDFPARPFRALPIMPDFSAALGAKAITLGLARDWFVLLESAAVLRALNPEPAALQNIIAQHLKTHPLQEVAAGVYIIITAPSNDPTKDILSRFFCPDENFFEDPVTGSAHCTLVPYWSEKLGKQQLQAQQLSRRGGLISCEYVKNQTGDRVRLGGTSRLYLAGNITI